MKHVAIIGAGIIGVTSAWVLRQQGHKVTIFDKNRYPAMETSFANGGLFGTFISLPSSLLIAQPAINPPILSAAISSPVKIPTTPEALSAFEVSTFFIFALA